MNATSSVSTAGRVGLAYRPEPPASAGEGIARLLPEPAQSSLGGYNPILILQTIMLAQRTGALATSNARITQGEAARNKAIQEQIDAHERERQASQSKGGFFSDLVKVIGDCSADLFTGRLDKFASDLNDEMISDPQFWKDLSAAGGEIAKWGAVVGSVAVAVVTCGAASAGSAAVILAVVGASLSTAAAVDSETHALEALGVDAKVASWVDLGASLAGSLATGGAGLASSGCQIANIAGKATTMTAACAGITEGIGDVGSAHFDSAADHANADVKAGEVREDFVKALIDDALDQAKALFERAKQKMDALSDAANANTQANLTMVKS